MSLKIVLSFSRPLVDQQRSPRNDFIKFKFFVMHQLLNNLTKNVIKSAKFLIKHPNRFGLGLSSVDKCSLVMRHEISNAGDASHFSPAIHATLITNFIFTEVHARNLLN